jgi:hypothetical protein
MSSRGQKIAIPAIGSSQHLRADHGHIHGGPAAFAGYRGRHGAGVGKSIDDLSRA